MVSITSLVLGALRRASGSWRCIHDRRIMAGEEIQFFHVQLGALDGDVEKGLTVSAASLVVSPSLRLGLEVAQLLRSAILTYGFKGLVVQV